MLDRSAVALCCFGLLVVLGCGGAPDVDRYDVSGSVTYDGQPVPAGTIVFQPTKGNTGPGATVEIKDGKYDTSLGGKAPTGGPHIASITGYDGKADPDNEAPMGQLLFDAYKTEVDLPKETTTQDFDVPADGKAPADG